MKLDDSDSPRSDAKSPSEPPINTIEGQLAKILHDLHGYELPLTGEVTLDADIDFGNKILQREITEATQAISTLITQARLDELHNYLTDGDGNFRYIDIREDEAESEYLDRLKELQNEQ